MPFTSQELAHIANLTLETYIEIGKIFSQSIQEKPLLNMLMRRKKTFPGGKDFISLAVKGVYSGAWQGYTHDDQVSYYNPANSHRAKTPWKEMHIGIKFTGTELKMNGIHVVDTSDGSTVQASADERIRLANILDDKLEDLDESGARSLNNMLWMDGTQDAKEIPGVTSWVVDNPAANITVLGINQADHPWWRNRANLSIVLGSDPSTLAVIHTLRNEIRQLRRYGGRPDIALAGSSFLDRLEKEAMAKGNFTMTGWQNGQAMRLGAAEPELNGVSFIYDPTLDDLGRDKRCYVLSSRDILFMPMEGEDMKRHNPPREHDRYVYYRAITLTAGLLTRRRNGHGVYGFA